VAPGEGKGAPGGENYNLRDHKMADRRILNCTGESKMEIPVDAGKDGTTEILV
jgi:hypothetical protein